MSPAAQRKGPSLTVWPDAACRGPSHPHQHRRQALRAASLVVTATVLCALALVLLTNTADSRGDAAISRRGGLGSLSQQQRTSMLDFDDDDDDDGDDDFGDDGGGGFGDGDGGGGGGLDSFSAADDLEDSGSYVGYLAWSDEKLQRVLNTTHAQLWHMMRQWNKTYAPKRLQAMRHKVWLLKNAFSGHGYLLKSAETGVENLRSLSERAVHKALGEIGTLTPQLNQELAHIVNQTHRVIAREARVDARQGRRLIRAEQIDLKTDAVVREKVQEAQQMLASLQKRVRNVTDTMMKSALAFGEAAAADMHSPAVEAELHQLPNQFSLRKLAIEAVEEQDMVHRKVAAEFERLDDMEAQEERLLARANTSTLALQRSDLRKEAQELHEDAVDEEKEQHLWHRVQALETHIRRQDTSYDAMTHELRSGEKDVGQVLARITDPCYKKRLHLREWAQVREGEGQGARARARVSEAASVSKCVCGPSFWQSCKTSSTGSKSRTQTRSRLWRTPGRRSGTTSQRSSSCVGRSRARGWWRRGGRRR